MWQPSCRKLGEKFNSNLVNEFVENEGEKKRRFVRKWKEKKLWQFICGNGIAEMRGKKIVATDLWQFCC